MNGPKFFGVVRDWPGITERNAWLILGVRVEGLRSQALQNGLKITHFACNVRCCISR